MSFYRVIILVVWKKLMYQNWSYPKNHKYGKKLKYQKVRNILLTEKHL